MPSPTLSLIQLRRDAKRLSRAHGLKHHEALDRIARSHGYQNWSLLAKNLAEQDVVPPAESAQGPSASLEGAEEVDDANALAELPKFEATRAETELIKRIVSRFCALWPTQSFDRLSLMMDLEACHCNGCPLNLEALAHVASDSDLAHDVAGINRHLDRDTGRLQNFFLPRYRSRQTE